MKRSMWLCLAMAALLCGGSLFAQAPIPEVPYDSVADPLRLPDNIHLGEAAGVATNSKGNIFVYTRTGAANVTVGTQRNFYRAGSRLFEFDPTGKFVREIGSGYALYGFNFAQKVKIDPQDNIWTVDLGSTQVYKFTPDARLALILGRKPEAVTIRMPPQPAPAAPAAGAPAHSPSSPTT